MGDARDPLDGDGPEGLRFSLATYARAAALLDARAVIDAHVAASARPAVAVVACDEGGAGRHACHAVHALSPRAGLPFSIATVEPDALPSSIDDLLAASRGTVAVDLGNLPDDMYRHFASSAVFQVSQREDCDLGVVAVVDRRRRRRDPLARFPVVAPVPLRDRREDIPDLAAYCASGFHAARRVHPEALAALMRAPWPGDIDEFVRAMEAADDARVERGGDVVELRDVPDSFLAEIPHERVGFLHESLAAAERAILRRALVYTAGMVMRSAAALGVPERTFRRKMRELGIGKEDFRARAGLR